MGFLSSLAKPFKKVFDFGKDLVGNVVESVVGDPLGAIGTVGKVVGGIMGNNSKSSANEANQELAQQQFQFQKDYIQNQMQWRMSDAQKAGIHPLAALGIQSPGFSPVSSSSSGLDYSWLGDLGQSANYSATKGKTTPEQQQMVDLQLRNMQLQNDLLQTQIDNMKVDALASSIAANQAFDSPPSPKVNLQEPTGLPTEPQFFNAIDWATNGDYHVPMLSEAVADRTDDDPYFKRAVQLGSLVEFADQHPGMYPPWKSLSDSERRKLISGHFHWVIHPFGFRLEPIPGHEKIVGSYSSDRTSYKGKIF